MKYTLLFLITCMYTTHAQNVTHKNPTLGDKLNNARKEQFHEDSFVDTSLINVAKYIHQYKVPLKNKDSIRVYMRGVNNYDYIFKVIKLKIKNIEIADINDLQKKSRKLREILQTHNYNKIGYYIGYRKRNCKVKIIASQNYICFDSISLSVPMQLFFPKTTTEGRIYIKGEKKLDTNDDFCYTKVKAKTNISGLNPKACAIKPLHFINSTTFVIDEPIHNEEIVIFNSKGEIVSHYIQMITFLNR